MYGVRRVVRRTSNRDAEGLLHGSAAVWSPSDFSKSSHRPCRNGSNFFNSESQLKISFFRSPLGTVPWILDASNAHSIKAW